MEEEYIEVRVLSGAITAKEINTKTNAKMGKRHLAYESMLRTFWIKRICKKEDKAIIPIEAFSADKMETKLTIGGIYKAKILNHLYDSDHNINGGIAIII